MGARPPRGIEPGESPAEALTREKGVDWAKHVIEYGGRIGAGMQIPVADIDGDGDLDFAVGGKSGLFLFENLTRNGGKAK